MTAHPRRPGGDPQKVWMAIGVLCAVAGLSLFLRGIHGRFSAPTTETLPSIPHQTSRKPDPSPTITSSVEAAMVQPSFRIPLRELDKQEEEKRIVKQEISPYKELLIRSLTESGWPQDEIDTIRFYLSDPRTMFLPEILKRNATHVENKALYTHHFDDGSIDRCVSYFETHNIEINRSATGSGVPPEIITAIIKVETELGKYAGKASVFNVFWSLAIGDIPSVVNDAGLTEDEEFRRLKKRAKWAKKELRDLIYMSHAGGENPVGIMGSWAGAFGLSQFLPSSYRAYGRDGNSDKIIDLDNIADASASIAGYLKENGWPSDRNRKRSHKSIMRYNHSSHYADCVLAIADSLRNRFNHLQP